MGQLDWEEDLDIVVGNAQVTGDFKGGIRKVATLPQVMQRLAEKWEEELRDGVYGYFVLELVGEDGEPIPGRTETVVCKSQDRAEMIAENLLGDHDKPKSYWRFREEWVR